MSAASDAPRKKRRRTPADQVDPVRREAGRKAWAGRLERASAAQIEGRRWMARVARGSYLGHDRASEMRARYAAGERIKDLAAAYGVSVATAWRAVRGKLWAPLRGD